MSKTEGKVQEEDSKLPIKEKIKFIGKKLQETIDKKFKGDAN